MFICLLIDSLFPSYFDNWISGFFNGEGSFYITSKGELRFTIEQTESNVLVIPLLFIINNKCPYFYFFIRIKNRYLRMDTRKKGVKRDWSFHHKYYLKKNCRKPTWQLKVSSKTDLKSLVKFFENPRLVPFQGNKYNQYTQWLATYQAKQIIYNA